MQLFLLLLAFGFRLAQSAPVEKSETQKRTLTYVTLEEHFDSRSILKYQEEDGVYKLYSQLYGPSANGATLANLSVRIPDMDKNDIRIQVRHALAPKRRLKDCIADSHDRSLAKILNPT